jgi:hypothetical protein
MGLDMYAYTANKAGQREDFYEGAQWDADKKEYVNPDIEKPAEIAYWRKHPDLHGWMYTLWESRGNQGDFNGDELELTDDDLDDLQITIMANKLPPTTGFFFGKSSNDYYKASDLEFIVKAREAINGGLRVFYNSSW